MMSGLALGLAALGLLAAGQSKQDAEVALQAAMHKQNVDGDLQDAIGQYKEILRKYRDNRPVAAQALLQMAQCYEKSGKDEARKLYEQVMREYADQSRAAALARARLTLLRRTEQMPGSGVSIRSIWAERLTDICGAPSPDGRYLSFVDWDTGDLAVRDLQTGKNRRLTDKGPWAKSEDFALFSRWSPDVKTIAYTWYTGKGSNITEVRLIGLEGGNPRILFKLPETGPWVDVLAWSPDGKEILVHLSQSRWDQWFSLLKVSDGSMRKIYEKRAAENRGADTSAIGFSPDGRYVLASRESERNNSDIILIPRDGGRAIPLVEHPAFDFALGWHPGGNWVLFSSDRSGNAALWAVPVRNGTAIGPARMLSASLPSTESLGLTRGGALFLGRSARQSNIYSVELDASGRLASPEPAVFIRRFEGVNTWPEFSPDGTRVAYGSSRAPRVRPGNSANWIAIFDQATGRTMEFATDLLIYNPLWAGSSLIFAALNERIQSWGIHRLDAVTGAMSAVKEWKEPTVLISHAVSRDGSTIYYSVADRQRDSATRVEVLDVRSGQSRMLFEGKQVDWPKMALSPDGRQLAFVNRAEEREIRVMPSTGGEVRTICQFRHVGNHIFEIAWSPDGKFIYFPRIEGEPGEVKGWSIWHVRVADGVIERFLPDCGRATKMSFSPDGRKLLFASPGRIPSQAEIWMMENYLPERGGPSN